MTEFPSLFDVRVAICKLAEWRKREVGLAATKIILKEFNAESASTVSEDRRGEFIKRCEDRLSLLVKARITMDFGR